VVLAEKGNAEQLDALNVSAGFFPMLGVTAALGRTFTPDEDQRGQPKPVAVLGYAFWQRRFGGRRDVIGRSLTFDGTPSTVIGILPPGFRWAGEPLAGTAIDIPVWLPMASNPLTSATPRSVRYMKVVGQRRPDVTLAQARDEIRRISTELAIQYPDFDRGYEADGRPLSEQVTGKNRSGMLLLLGMVGFVLLMACANVANLLLARAAVRSREITIRIAVGASAFRLVRQLLTEGLVLSVLGGVLGIPLAYAGVLALMAVGPSSLLHPGEIRIDPRALAFTSVAVLLCAILAGLPPAWRMARPAIASALRESGRGLTAGHHHVRATLVIVQVAAALVLLVGAGLLIRSFQQLLAVQPGFDSHNLVTIATQLPSSARTPDQRRAVYERIRQSLMAQPGVSNVAAISRMPFSGKNLGIRVHVEGKEAPGTTPGVEVEYRVATPSYFETMGVPLRAGRLYDQRDDANPGTVVVINEAMAHHLWPGQPAVGKRIKMSGAATNAPWTAVIGVVGNVRHFGLEADPRSELYRPYLVNPLGAPILAIRTRSDPAPLVQALSARVRAIDPAIPTYNEFVMEKLVASSTMQRRFVMLLLAGFAAAALLLAGLGIYGTMSQAVAQRTQEIGVRIALGASSAEVLRLVIGEGARLMLAGVAVGAIAAAALAGVMRTMLFEVRPLDPLAFAGATATLAAFALAACYIPARRATHVDPMVALRDA
jgi:putative ABC transport system permease protein